MSSKITKYLYNEVSLIISVIAVAIAITLFIVKPDAKMEMDIALIAQKVEAIEMNDLPHLGERLKTIEDDITEIKLNIREILTILKK